ncbi:MAG: glycosyltransferase family 4 protein [Candidatus Dormibacteraeota bacterium]|nr:glycosyltransferase family 4 protein [Candidatus Dormibacteraeota bacterium]
MRLGIDAWGLSRDGLYSGVGQYAFGLIRHLSGRFPTIEIVAYAGPGEQRPAWVPSCVAWRPVPALIPSKFAAFASRILWLPGLTRKDGIDLFHAPAVHIRPSLPPVPRLPCPVVVTLHDLIPLTYYDLGQLPRRQRVFYRWNLNRVFQADALITVSEHSAREIASLAGSMPDQLSVIPNAIDFAPNPMLAPLHRLGIERPYVLYAGSFEPRKNLARALSAFAELTSRGFPHQLVAVVERQSGHAATIRAHLDKLGVRDRVRFQCNLPESDLRALYTHADVLFFPSLAEGFGFPPLQAAACGLPVVTSDLPVLRANMQGEAIFVDPLDVGAMADGLHRALSDRKLRNRLRESGPRLAAPFTVDRWVRHHAETYERVLAGPRLAVS